MIFLLIPSINIAGILFPRLSRVLSARTVFTQRQLTAGCRIYENISIVGGGWLSAGTAVCVSRKRFAGRVGGSFLPGIVLGRIGAAILTLGVPAGSKAAPVIV
jgi:hypothetical protein